ncbi:MAG: STAS domain-containing protein [Thiotrichaceae bacterium]|nr:STAS domain-containing protein [Thiotrichaceae bacterium]PCI14761.1 MAG: anti-sigma-factor [Thiotrichales bacterium]
MASNSAGAQLESQPDGVFLLSGELSFASVPGVLRASQPLLTSGIERDVAITIDLQGVGRSDSAGIALLVEWARNANYQNSEITFLNIPPQMLALARLSGLEAVLGLSPIPS